ncbi:hypothetical protein AC1031_017264 [Aphanomyces cochlioides]|nr:hypothetical protein AC1031_017264 [Aphanomyces cochlioides]
MKRREAAFDSNVHNQKLPEYNALADHNLRHFFENRKLQQHLFDVGLIDKAGRVIDPDKHKGKLAILQQEFKLAEKSELMKQREEEEIRRRGENQADQGRPQAHQANRRRRAGVLDVLVADFQRQQSRVQVGSLVVADTLFQ